MIEISMVEQLERMFDGSGDGGGGGSGRGGDHDDFGPRSGQATYGAGVQLLERHQ
eukprot:TRINITY_DN17363_c0_g1_i1.p4 TRINITY_DN17363_c0_g1~~TRINITY_DN17363_c0_g1_i1.p4  ORF type:complete len:55 (+),score=7.64 TRINITY_DN17363_c0_g1_i1:202-366(+)